MITSYKELPVGLWLDIRKIQEETHDPVDARVAIVAILTGKTEREILNAPLSESSEWFARAEFLETPDPDIPSRIAASYKAGPFDLVPTTDLRKITTAQYIDFQNFAPEGERKLVELLSVFLIPKGLDYNEGYDIAEVQQAIREDLSVLDTLALSAFFLNKYAALIRRSRSSLARLEKKEKNPAMKEAIRRRLEKLKTLTELLTDSPTSGAGSPTSTR